MRWHYHPISVEAGGRARRPPSPAPTAKARVFAAVSLADKLDTLAGYFGLGESPTGSRDPYGLRRAAQGAVRVVLDFWRAEGGREGPRPRRRCVAAAVAGYGPG